MLLTHFLFQKTIQYAPWICQSISGKRFLLLTSFRTISVWRWKMVSASVRYLFYQSMDEKIKLGLLGFTRKKTLICRKHCSIGQSCCNVTSKQSIDWFLESSHIRHEVFSPERSLNQPKATRVCVRSIDQSNRFIPLICCFCFVLAFSFQGHPKIALLLLCFLSTLSI